MDSLTERHYERDSNVNTGSKDGMCDPITKLNPGIKRVKLFCLKIVWVVP